MDPARSAEIDSTSRSGSSAPWTTALLQLARRRSGFQPQPDSAEPLRLHVHGWGRHEGNGGSGRALVGDLAAPQLPFEVKLESQHVTHVTHVTLQLFLKYPKDPKVCFEDKICNVSSMLYHAVPCMVPCRHSDSDFEV